MLKLKIKNNVNEVENYCNKNIGRRLYYTHLSRGGQGWCIKRVGLESELHIEDDKKAVLAILVLGSYLK